MDGSLICSQSKSRCPSHKRKGPVSALWRVLHSTWSKQSLPLVLTIDPNRQSASPLAGDRDITQVFFCASWLLTLTVICSVSFWGGYLAVIQAGLELKILPIQPPGLLGSLHSAKTIHSTAIYLFSSAYNHLPVLPRALSLTEVL